MGSLGSLLAFFGRFFGAAVVDGAEAKYICRQILDGMEHMHAKNVLHRDLKLENILIQDCLPRQVYYETRGCCL